MTGCPNTLWEYKEINVDEQTARDKAAVLRQQIALSMHASMGEAWSETIDITEVQNQGRLTLAKLYSTAAFCWKAFDLASTYGSLLMYKG